MKYKIIFDKNKCEENMVCVARCPKFWELNQSQGKVYLKGSKDVGNKIFELVISDKDYDCNKKAADGCPKKAITIKKI